MLVVVTAKEATIEIMFLYPATFTYHSLCRSSFKNYYSYHYLFNFYFRIHGTIVAGTRSYYVNLIIKMLLFMHPGNTVICWKQRNLRYRNYASPSSGDAYCDRQLTLNFEFWVKIFCSDMFPYEDSEIVTVCPSVRTPRKEITPIASSISVFK